MLPHATQILKVLTYELDRHQKVLEIDRSISKIQLTVILDRRTGDPVKTIYQPQHESHLDEKSENGRLKTLQGASQEVKY